MQTKQAIEQYLNIAEHRLKQLQDDLKKYLKDPDNNPNAIPVRTGYIVKVSDEMKPIQTEINLLKWVLEDKP